MPSRSQKTRNLHGRRPWHEYPSYPTHWTFWGALVITLVALSVYAGG